ncbi:WD40 repeat domain-containing serine/threonine protein kinase [Actinomadura sp. K4S16]|uniref:WD40 repeat domain-containing serine/threonine protein kinase n=1 Tax=Actinomadura sp. K4S16 TaxID=1316147 RepID=UPI0011EE16E2|nr:serine/threonine-protein kinase [Actinomadura sp. K4S16]
MDPLRDGDPRRIGPYRLEGRLGAGGMGEVFLGATPGGRRVAVKVIRAEYAQDARFRVRFAREVEAARKVGGFYTAQVVDADPEAAEPWMATAYVPGPSLREAAPLDVPAVRALGAALAEGLAAIHASGLVHRDLKPGNVIMSPDGPRIIDFGIARAAGATALTSTGAVVGTYAFMSPEQVRADTAGPASDVFSLGCVLAFAATGRGPFDAENVPGIVHRIVSAPPDLTGVPAELRPAIVTCLAKEPDRRPAPAEAARLLAAPPGRTGRRTVLAGGAAAGVAAVLGVPALLWRRSEEDAAPLKDPRPVVLAGGPVATFRLAFTPDSKTLVCAAAEQIWRWTVATGRGTVHELGDDGADQLTALSGDGRLLATLRGKGPIRLWEAATGARLRTVMPAGRAFTKALSEDGRALATVGANGVELWDTATGRRTGVFAPRNDATRLTFDATGDRIAVSGGGDVQVHDLRADRDVANAVAGTINVLFAFAPDGRTAATDIWDRTHPDRATWAIRILDLRAGKRIRDLEGHEGTVQALAFSPDGRALASAAQDGTIRLWDTRTGDGFATLEWERSDGTALAFSPDGRLLAAGAGSSDGSVRLWRFS